MSMQLLNHRTAIIITINYTKNSIANYSILKPRNSFRLKKKKEKIKIALTIRILRQTKYLISRIPSKCPFQPAVIYLICNNIYSFPSL